MTPPSRGQRAVTGRRVGGSAGGSLRSWLFPDRLCVSFLFQLSAQPDSGPLLTLQ